MPLTDRLPEGYEAVDLSPGASDAEACRLRVCLLAKAEPDPVGGRFVVLGGSLDTRSLLGCVVDPAESVVDWLRIVVHDVDRLAETGALDRGGMSNAALEQRWARGVRALAEVGRGETVAIGWESQPAPVTAYDPRKRCLSEIMHEASGEMFAVCRDDRVLLEKGLPPFSASLHRYLWIESLGSGSPFVAVTSGAPDSGQRLEDVLTGVNREFEPVNARGGMMMARRLNACRLEDLIDVIGGSPLPAVRHGAGAVDLSPPRSEGVELAAEAIDSDRLFLGRHGRWGRLVETLHLKLRLVTEMVREARDVVARTGRPLFNLTPESFEASVEGPGSWVPRLWTCRVRLIDAGTSVELPIEAAGARLVTAPEGVGKGIYKPVLRAEGSSGTGTLLVRENRVEGGLSESEVTLRSQDPVSVGPSDLVVLRVHLAGDRVVLYGRTMAGETGDVGSGGQARLRTIPQKLEAKHEAALSAASGVPLEGVQFEVIPVVSTPCDLHALGVLAARVLLAGPELTLAVAVDDLLTLARLAGEAEGGGAAERLESVFLADADTGGGMKRDSWAERLGPHRLVHERVDAAEGLDLVPPELWFGVLSVVTRMFPGAGADSYCRDLGDAAAAAPQRIFDAVLSDLDGLLVRTRSLMVIDWRQNREVHGVLRRFREGLDAPEANVIPELG